MYDATVVPQHPDGSSHSLTLTEMIETSEARQRWESNEEPSSPGHLRDGLCDKPVACSIVETIIGSSRPRRNTG